MRYYMMLLLAGLVVTACSDQTSIQRSYLSERDDCQGEAEDSIGDYEGDNEDPRARNAKLVTLFSDCMFEHGWTVAAPDREPGGVESVLDARTKPQDTSVGVGDTIKPGQTTAPPYEPAPIPAPSGAPTAAPPAPAGYRYQLVPVQ